LIGAFALDINTSIGRGEHFLKGVVCLSYTHRNWWDTSVTCTGCLPQGLKAVNLSSRRLT